ncbi:glycine oxidase [Granulicella rosea]|uniref:Glycine oxidase n=1 Tax=Granulicella rosea TaxID=474952 RepID=A0A239MC01_9BACT|nr:FAD-dependent oxidoreductase [Granulicella rosea]SNT40111.1 glycine oxidase [Granulicella rosea]
MQHPDIVIAGAGIVGLSLALELQQRGLRVTVLDAGQALAQASTAAAGMLAVDDPHNPILLKPLSRLSASLYPAYLDRIAELSGQRVDFQTTSTLQAVPEEIDYFEPDAQLIRELVPQLVPGSHRFALLDERSVDPRQLAPALLAAVREAGVTLLEGTPLARIASTGDGVRVETGDGQSLHAGYLVDCMGAWTPAPVAPRKGQLFSVTLPPSLALETVVRTQDIYIVPRTQGANAGRAVIGATVEFAGFDKTVKPAAILALNARAVALLPQLAEAHLEEAWSGLRPATEDELPILGAIAAQPRYVLANGLYRNGILLAPGTARVIAQLLMQETPEVDLAAFSPARF